MRLIDADALIEAMKKTEDEHEKAMTCPSWWSAFNVISEQPTAYSVEKVVEELEMEMKASSGYSAERVSAFSRAIEIVKQGGVSDDVCELRLLNGHKFLHETSCGDVFDMQNGFKYCPYCGKKIKVVGQMNKRQWKKKGTKLRHNGHYASYVALFLGLEIKGKPHLDRKWLKR